MNPEHYPTGGPERASEIEVALLYADICALLSAETAVCVDESQDPDIVPEYLDGIIIARGHTPHHSITIDADVVYRYAPLAAEILEIEGLDILNLNYTPLHCAETDEIYDGYPAVSICEYRPSLELKISRSDRDREWTICPATEYDPNYGTTYKQEYFGISEREYLLSDEVAAFRGIFTHLSAMNRDMGL